MSRPNVQISHSDDSQTAIIVHTFFLLITLHPSIQKKAQAEIDDVVGRDRLPNFEDRERLPYVNALLKGMQSLALALFLG